MDHIQQLAPDRGDGHRRSRQAINPSKTGTTGAQEAGLGIFPTIGYTVTVLVQGSTFTKGDKDPTCPSKPYRMTDAMLKKAYASAALSAQAANAMAILVRYQNQLAERLQVRATQTDTGELQAVAKAMTGLIGELGQASGRSLAVPVAARQHL
ncbi:UNVERIFIED_CONTAM: hypothetical protein FKN15_056590 [Acipenser sinensis]